MSMLLYFLKSWMIGVAIAAPVGPIGMLCVKKTVELGFKGALLVGLGAALADSVYGLVAALGLSAISHVLLEQTHIIKIVGGMFLLYLAYKEGKGITANTEEQKVKNRSSIKLLGEVFFLTITNPITILSFIGIFASIGSGSASTSESAVMVLGIFLGSMTWWCVLGSIMVTIKHKLSQRWLEGIKWLSCAILAGFGFFAVAGSIIY